MSSILITGMKMPTYEQGDLVLRVRWDGRVDKDYSGNTVATAVPVPPHGRLIDADELHSALRKRAKEFSDSEYGEGVKCGLADAREYIKIAPAIIPAEMADDG